MSGSAQIDQREIEEIAVEMVADVGEVLNVGCPIEGHMYRCIHECPTCHSKVETAGVGHPALTCSWCESMRGLKSEMKRRFECLEILA